MTLKSITYFTLSSTNGLGHHGHEGFSALEGTVQAKLTPLGWAGLQGTSFPAHTPTPNINPHL